MLYAVTILGANGAYGGMREFFSFYIEGHSAAAVLLGAGTIPAPPDQNPSPEM